MPHISCISNSWGALRLGGTPTRTIWTAARRPRGRRRSDFRDGTEGEWVQQVQVSSSKQQDLPDDDTAVSCEEHVGSGSIPGERQKVADQLGQEVHSQDFLVDQTRSQVCRANQLSPRWGYVSRQTFLVVFFYGGIFCSIGN